MPVNGKPLSAQIENQVVTAVLVERAEGNILCITPIFWPAVNQCHYYTICDRIKGVAVIKTGFVLFGIPFTTVLVSRLLMINNFQTVIDCE